MSPSARLFSLAALALLLCTSPRASALQVRWSAPASTPPGGDVTALALDASGAVAVGGLRGAYERTGAGGLAARLRRGPVTDLAFLDGALLVATAEGLHRVRDGRAVREPLAPGGRALALARLAAAGGLAAAATDAGVFLRGPGARWRPARELPSGDARFVALRSRARDVELWCAIDGEVWVASLDRESSEMGFAQRVPLARAERADGALDAVFGLGEADVVLVHPTSLATRGPDGRWHTRRPALPPGARIVRLARALGRPWLATDAGLLVATSLEGPWRRAAPPLGTTPVTAIAGTDRVLWVATRRGLSRGVERTSAPVLAGGAGARPRAGEPSVREVHRAALAYVSLQPERLRAMHRGVRRRGWLPEVALDAGYDRRDARAVDDDQAFTSGDMRYLTDTRRDRQDDFDVGLTLSWDLGDVAFHPEEIDVLRESRAVIALRDDVLDEITQIYFERRRVLGALARQPEASPERDALSVRADELAAGLDAWTGGWFSRRIETARSVPGPPLPTPNRKDR